MGLRHIRSLLGLAFGVMPFAALAAVAPVPALTIEQLVEDGARYQGRTVQIRGQLNNCHGACEICPEGTTTQTLRDAICLSLVFGPQVPGDTAISGTDHDLMTTMYRFAVVTIEARFTAACVHGPGGKLLYFGPIGTGVVATDTGKEVICLSHGPVDLSQGQVLQVHSRKTVLDGLVDPQSIWDELVPADPDERDAVLGEWDRTAGTTYPEVFTVKDKQKQADIAPDNYDGLACSCLESSCVGRWPTHLVFGMNSPANPFYCWIIKKTASGWRVLLNDQ
jgi:hypothetical protein